MRSLGGWALAIAAVVIVSGLTTVRAPLAATRDPFLQLIASSTDLGPADPNATLPLVLLVRDPSEAAQSAALTLAYTPGSATFGRYLSDAEFATTYGPSPNSMAKLRVILAQDGLSVDWTAGDDWLIVEGLPARLRATFKVDPQRYRAPSGSLYVASPRDPTIPTVIAGLIKSSGHLTTYMPIHDYTVPTGGLTPADISKAYDLNPLRDAGIDGTGETVVITVPDGGYRQDALDAFTKQFPDLPRIQPIDRTPSSTITCPSDPTAQVPGACDELTMDLEIVHAIAPGARLVVYTFPGGDATPEFVKNALDFQSQMVKENAGAIITQSWGWCENTWGSAGAEATKETYDEADRLGETVFASTGDSGAYTCLEQHPDDIPTQQDVGLSLPAAAPGVTAVGGTRLSLGTDGSWYNETTWEEPTELAGSGGGFSLYFSRPPWQVGPGVDAPAAGAQREIPDVSADAEPDSGAAIFDPSYGWAQGSAPPDGWTMGGGTSQAAPIWAGVTALINQYLKQRGLNGVGWLNPALYALARESEPYAAFHDVTVGTNLLFPATPGYDMATGLGTPDGWNLARDLEAYLRRGGSP